MWSIQILYVWHTEDNGLKQDNDSSMLKWPRGIIVILNYLFYISFMI